MADTYELRPMTIGELLDRAFTIYRRRFVLLAGIAAVAQVVPLVGLSALALMPPRPSMAGTVLLVATALLTVLLVAVAYLFSQAAAVQAVSALVLGEDISIVEAYRRTRGGIARLVGLLVLMGLGILGGYVMCIVPSIIFGLYWSVAIPALVLERLAPMDAMKRSWNLVRGHGGRAFVLALLYVAVSLAAALVLAVPAQVPLWISTSHGQVSPALGVLGQVGSSVANVISSSLWNIMICLFYYDLRIRKEGFDVEHLLGHLGGESAQEPPPIG
jgi:membrane-anchored glycerophosphoryl diester phosphodiesterase (GDPDase)